MMRNFTSIIIFSFLLIFAASEGTAQPRAKENTASKNPLQTIMLKDGTVIKGKLIDVIDDHYIIQTQHLGKVEVLVSDLQSITTEAPKPAQSTSSKPPPQTGLGINPSLPTGPIPGLGLPQDLLTDPEILSSAQELANDQEILNLLQDESLMQSILMMDMEKMQNNPRIQELLQNPKMQEMINKLMQKMQPSAERPSDEYLEE